MNNDLNASERRLIAALDRLDGYIDRVAATRAAALPPDGGTGTGEDVADPGLSAMLDEQAEELAVLEARVAATAERLDAAGEEIARLAAANEALASANRDLIAAQPDPGTDEIRRALQAEIDSLRANRAAEIGQMSDIADTLDRMLAAGHAGDDLAGSPTDALPPATGGAPAVVETPRPPRKSVDLDLGGDTLSDSRETQTVEENRG